MKTSLLLFCVAGAVAAQAQTAHKPASSSAKTATAHSAATHSAAASNIKLPPGVPPVSGPVKTEFSLRYQDIKIGTGPEAEPMKLYKVFYTGYRAADGVKFDSSDDHRKPITGADGKPEMDANGKPKLGDPEPLVFPQGMGRLIPGFDEGFIGMHVGGKRRLFIPWQLAYGTRDLPDRDGHPGIPARSDLIFDVELVDMADLPMPSNRPMGAPGQVPPPTAHPSGSGVPGGSGSVSKPAQPAQPAQPSQPSAPPQH